MKNYIITILTLFLASFGFSQDVKLTHNLPSSANPGQTILAEFSVTKGNIGAFAKFQCDLPAGFEAQAGDTKSGNFTFENGRVKIVWVSLPADPTFTFSFKIIVPASGGSASIAAQFFYLENNVKKEFDVPAHTISISGGAVVTNSGGNNSGGNTSGNTGGNTESNSGGNTSGNTGGNTVSNTGGNMSGNTGGNTSGNTGGNTTPTETKTTRTSTSRSGVTYYIQVAALSTDPGMGTKYKKYGKVKIVQENGMYKVLVGTYNSLEDARSHKPEMANKGADGCFVVGYENGVRIKL
jgi:hypothetical protein